MPHIGLLLVGGGSCSSKHQGSEAEFTVVQVLNQGTTRRPRRIRLSVPFLVPFCLPQKE
jgi:hypothetical protein